MDKSELLLIDRTVRSLLEQSGAPTVPGVSVGGAGLGSGGGALTGGGGGGALVA